ncbi:MAG: SAM-dependent methyltransferase [Microcoleaceae cyanobacterium]
MFPIHIGYIPTPTRAVEAALRLAELSQDDILYDLGCGDGRVVIAAAQQCGVQAVGIDTDAQRIAEAQRNSARAGVTNQVEFRHQNLFESDFEQATVVFLYLLPHLNLRLKPLLLETLKPRSRIISRDFDMGEWLPERKIFVPDAEEECHLLRWTIPEIWETPENL